MEEVIHYTTEEGAVAIEVNLRDETVWLSLNHLLENARQVASAWTIG